MPNPQAALGFQERAFVTTHWSFVVAAQNSASPQTTEALGKLCQSYWYPLYAYARQLRYTPADAEDLTQGFFARLVEKDFLKAADQDKGRFRTFLLTAFKRYITNEWDRQHTQKRGGFANVVPLDQQLAEVKLAAENPDQLPPDVLYDRHWAGALLDRTMSLLSQEYVATGRTSLFELLRPCLVKDESALPYQDIAHRLNLSEAAVKMAVLRLRARYREILRGGIAQTVASPQDIEQEIQDLFCAFNT